MMMVMCCAKWPNFPPCQQVSAGGSLSNTLLALARLGRAEDALCSRGPLRVAFDGIVGGDALSAFYSAQMREAGVSVLAEPGPNSSTGGNQIISAHSWASPCIFYDSI